MDLHPFEARPDGESPQPQPPAEPGDAPAGGREPILNAAWPVVAVTVGLMALYLIQTQFPPAQIQRDFAFSPVLLAQGHYERLVTAIFVHGAWAHVMIDAGMALAFGALVADVMGSRIRGAVVYIAFFITCGVAGLLAFTALRWGHTGVAIGASGATSGLMGAAARIVGGEGRIGPMFSKAVLRMGAGWFGVNLMMAFSGDLLIPGKAYAVVGWQPHIGGFVAGVLLVGLFARLAGEGPDAFAPALPGLPVSTTSPD